MATGTALDLNSVWLYAYSGADIPPEYSCPLLSPLDSIPSTAAQPCTRSIPAQPGSVELAIKKALKDRCIFYGSVGSGCEELFNFLHKDYPVSFEYNGLKFLCATAAIEAQRFAYRSELMKKFTVVQANEVTDVSDKITWNTPNLDNEEEIHYQVQRAKFSQNPDLLQKLLLTADAYLVAHAFLQCSAYGLLWTDGHHGKGQNKAGQILMRIRKELGGVGVVAKPANFDALLTKLNDNN